MTLLSTYRAARVTYGQVSCRGILAPSAPIVSEWMQHLGCLFPGASQQPQETPDPGEAGAGGHGGSQWAGRGALRLYCGGGACLLLEETESGWQ